MDDLESEEEGGDDEDDDDGHNAEDVADPVEDLACGGNADDEKVGGSCC